MRNFREEFRPRGNLQSTPQTAPRRLDRRLPIPQSKNRSRESRGEILAASARRPAFRRRDKRNLRPRFDASAIVSVAHGRIPEMALPRPRRPRRLL